MAEDLADALADGTSERPLGFWHLPARFDRALAVWSTTGPIGYVEAEYFGGIGSQRSTLWAEGELAFGPALVDEGQPWPDEGGPISQALARLGVDRAGFIGEFDAVRLGEHRYTEDWSE